MFDYITEHRWVCYLISTSIFVRDLYQDPLYNHIGVQAVMLFVICANLGTMVSILEENNQKFL